jgi:hypothetical protein
MILLEEPKNRKLEHERWNGRITAAKLIVIKKSSKSGAFVYKKFKRRVPSVLFRIRRLSAYFFLFRIGVASVRAAVSHH